MPNQLFTSQTQNVALFQNNGGLNTTASVLAVEDNESTDLSNIDLDLWGTIRKRQGYKNLNSSAMNSGAIGNGVYFYETVSGTDYLMGVFGDKLYKMDSLDGTFDDITGSISLTAGQNNQVQWKTYRNTVIGTNNLNAPFKWNASGGVATTITVNNGGSNYTVGDLIFLTGAGDGTAVVKVATVGGSNAVATITFVGGGSGYSVANGITTSAPDSPTLGSGCTLNVTAVTTNAVALAVPTGMTRARSVEVFFGHTLLANVTISGVDYKSRIYWSSVGTIERWWDADWADVERDDGQEIVCIRSLGDRLVIFKEQSIHIAMYTGDTDVPYQLAKTPSNVGCIARDSVQEVNNGLVFLSYDGLYYFDGSNSTKISDKLNYTFKNDLSKSRYDYAQSTMYRSKNQYLISLTNSGSTENNVVYIWDYYTKGFSKYDDLYPNAMTTITSSNEERPYFVDSKGWCYRLDTGFNDWPEGTETAISSYYKTKWFHFGDLVCHKAIPQVVIYVDYGNSSLTIGHSFDFEGTNQYSQTISLASSAAVYGSAVYGTSTYAGSGGFPYRLDMVGRGRVFRLSFENNTISETFKLSGFGMSYFLETAAS